MREILFRGKRIDNGEWVEGFIVSSRENTYPNGFEMITVDGINYDELDSYIPDFISYAVDTSTVGQYTGMKDKNGERIFDGDVAKVLQGKDKDIAYVGFENGAFMLYPKTGNIYERTLWEYWYNDWDVEVIGNITDNPELLEK